MLPASPGRASRSARAATASTRGRRRSTHTSRRSRAPRVVREDSNHEVFFRVRHGASAAAAASGRRTAARDISKMVEIERYREQLALAPGDHVAARNVAPVRAAMDHHRAFSRVQSLHLDPHLVAPGARPHAEHQSLAAEPIVDHRHQEEEHGAGRQALPTSEPAPWPGEARPSMRSPSPAEGGISPDETDSESRANARSRADWKRASGSLLETVPQHPLERGPDPGVALRELGRLVLKDRRPGSRPSSRAGTRGGRSASRRAPRRTRRCPTR